MPEKKKEREEYTNKISLTKYSVLDLVREFQPHNNCTISLAQYDIMAKSEKYLYL
jgi:hypothetical protein